MSLYEHHDIHKQRTKICLFCRAHCVPLAVVVPRFPLREGYHDQRRHIFSCPNCFSSVVCMEAKSSKAIYRVGSA